jgi:dipeptidyl aminopeptidase/acylaminoacyl peptidase
MIPTSTLLLCFASVGNDKTVELWDVACGKEVLRLSGHEDWVLSVAFSPDGLLIASGGNDGTVRLWDARTGKERLRLTGHKGAVSSVAFAPDGHTLVSASWDTTALVWDLSGLLRPRMSPAPLPVELNSLWKGLASDDARVAHRTVLALASSPQTAIPFLSKRLQKVSFASAGQIKGWVADLDSDRFAVRRAAFRELEKAGPAAEPALRRTLTEGPSLEVRRRVEKLLDELKKQGFAPDWIRLRRAVRALEYAGTPEARQVIRSLARKGLAEAKAAQERLGR